MIEVVQAVYGAASTQAAFEKASDPQLRELRGQIEALRAQVAKAGDEANAARVALLTAQGQFVALLASNDHGYAEAIAQFRTSVADIAASPEGVATLGQYNAGDEIGALAVFDKLRTANDNARRTQSKIASAAEARRIAGLALDARDRGKVTTEAAIARYEEVVKLDPRLFWDWIELDRLYLEAWRLRDAVRAAIHARETAVSDLDRARALTDLGIILAAQHDLLGAEKAFAESLEISRTVADADPGNLKAASATANNLIDLGNLRYVKSDSAAAYDAYIKSLADDRRLVAANPTDVRLQESLSKTLNNLGAVLIAQHNLAGARDAFVSRNCPQYRGNRHR